MRISANGAWHDVEILVPKGLQYLLMGIIVW